jgi:S1-C subfamily serine protease
MPPSPPSAYPPLPAASPALAPRYEPVPDHRSSKFGAAIMGAVVGAIVAALISGAILMNDDDRTDRSATSGTSQPAGPNLRLGGPALDIQALLQRAEPSVVTINSISAGGGATGTGFVITDDGYIVTNNHVVEVGETFQVVFADGKDYPAVLVGSFPENDLAMLKIEADAPLIPAVLGSSTDLRVGDDVVAIGNALNLGTRPSVTRGIVSAKDRILEDPAQKIYLTDMIQTDAAINQGNSGGPLFDASGEVVGINTAIIPTGQSVGFSISIDSVKPLIEKLKAGDGEISPDNAFLGVSSIDVGSADLNPSILQQYGVTATSGAFVSDVQADSPASKAGLQKGDVIVSIDDEDVPDSATVGEIVRSHTPGDVVSVSIEREGQSQDIEVTLGKRG